MSRIIIFFILWLFYAAAHEWYRAESIESTVQWASEQIEAQRRAPPHCDTYRNGMTSCYRVISLLLNTSALSLQEAFELCNYISTMGPSGKSSMLSLSTAYPEGKVMSMFGPTDCSALVYGYEQQYHLWFP